MKLISEGAGMLTERILVQRGEGGAVPITKVTCGYMSASGYSSHNDSVYGFASFLLRLGDALYLRLTATESRGDDTHTTEKLHLSQDEGASWRELETADWPDLAAAETLDTLKR